MLTFETNSRDEIKPWPRLLHGVSAFACIRVKHVL